MVSAYPDCVLWTTSNPSSFSASVIRRAKNTLESMTRILGDGVAEELTAAPPLRPASPDSRSLSILRRLSTFQLRMSDFQPVRPSQTSWRVHTHRSQGLPS